MNAAPDENDLVNSAVQGAKDGTNSAALGVKDTSNTMIDEAKKGYQVTKNLAENARKELTNETASLGGKIWEGIKDTGKIIAEASSNFFNLFSNTKST